MAQMTDDELISLIERHEAASIQAYGSTEAAEQAENIDFYNSRPFGAEEEGRSAVVSADVFEVVEGMCPMVLKPFVSSDDVVKFTPNGPDDEESAQQETDYINYIATQRNDVFETLVSWVKTGLLQKNGVVKYWWETSENTSIERYQALSDDVYTLILQDKNIKVISHTQGANEQGEVTHDVELRVVEEVGKATYAVIPPEEFRISKNATSPNPKKADFCQHITYKTLNDLRELGHDVDDDINDTASDAPRDSVQYLARNSSTELMMGDNADLGDKSMREVLYRETYMLVDYNGDGLAELRRVCLVGTTILVNEETEEIPFCGWTPNQQPFKYHGKCPADEVKEIQKVKSTLIRQTMDNVYTISNNKTYIGAGVNIDDMMNNAIGGFVRIGEGFGTVKDNIQEAAITPINGVTMPMIEYWDTAKENRTGWNRYNQGMDADSMNKTATGIRIITEAGNERAGLISRSFAELGLKNLMIGLHGLCRRHATKAETIQIRGKWVEINPRNWKTRHDMSISVGLGTADKQVQMQGAQLLLDKQMALMPTGIVTPKNFYEAAARLAQSVGEKSPERYFTAPDEQPQQQPPPPDPMQDPEFMLKAAESKRKDQELQLKVAEFELKKESTAISNAAAAQDYQLREKEATRAGLESFARLQRDIEGEPVKPEDVEAKEMETQALATIVQNQQSMMDAMTQFMQAAQQTNALIEASIIESRKPQSIAVQKRPDGSFVGVKTPVEVTDGQPEAD